MLRFNTTSVPEAVTDDAAPFIAHWLFWITPAAPGVNGPVNNVSASLYRKIELLARS